VTVFAVEAYTAGMGH